MRESCSSALGCHSDKNIDACKLEGRKPEKPEGRLPAGRGRTRHLSPPEGKRVASTPRGGPAARGGKPSMGGGGSAKAPGQQDRAGHRGKMPGERAGSSRLLCALSPVSVPHPGAEGTCGTRRDPPMARGAALGGGGEAEAADTPPPRGLLLPQPPRRWTPPSCPLHG